MKHTVLVPESRSCLSWCHSKKRPSCPFFHHRIIQQFNSPNAHISYIIYMYLDKSDLTLYYIYIQHHWSPYQPILPTKSAMGNSNSAVGPSSDSRLDKMQKRLHLKTEEINTLFLRFSNYDRGTQRCQMA